MYSGESTRALPRVGFPIRRSRDQRSVSTSPGLIAAAHVLHRLSAPRHPPCALVLLIEKNTFSPLWSFQGARDQRCGHLSQQSARLSKLNSVSSNQSPRATAGEACVVRGPAERRGRRNSRRDRTLDDQRTIINRPTTSGVIAPEFPRKEVIQPQLPLRLPCYDFTPIINPTFDGSLPQGVRPPASGVADFRGVTGGVYKARERIHRGVADPRLLATPTSWRRVSASNPNRDRLFGIRSPSRVCSPLYRPM